MRNDRLWLLGGAFCALVIVGFGYYFFIRPEKSDTRSTNESADRTRVEVAAKRKELRELAKQYERIDEYRAQLAKDQAALPGVDAASALLKELQNAGEQAGVSVSGVSVGTAVDLDALVGFEVYALPVSLTVVGPTDRMNPFLDQLQQVQPRAVLINSVNFAPSSTANLAKSNVTINLSAFYAPLT
jgi:Tfp pilus assembly protein PilO